MRRSLLVVLLVAASLRLAGLGFGLDLSDASRTVLQNQVDERGMVQAELDGLLAGHLHPGDFLHRGAGAFYLLGAFDAAALLPVALAGDGGWSGMLARLDGNPSLLFLLHRIASALAGIATVALVVRIGRRELSERAGLLAGAMLATGYLHVRESHFGTVDVLWGLLTLLTLDQALLLARDGRPGRSVAAGLLAGATAATKYFGVLLLAHLVVAHVGSRRAGHPRAGRRLLLSLLAVPAGFVLLSPYLFFAAGDLRDMVAWSLDNIGADPGGGGLAEALSHHARYTLLVGLGEPVLLLALAGLLLSLRRGGAALRLALFALLLVPCLVVTGHHPVRFGVALAVALVPLAALAADALLARPWLRSRGAAVAVMALVLLPSTARSVAFDALVAREDTRLQMLDVLAARGAAPADVAAWGVYGLPRVAAGQPAPFTDLVRASVKASAKAGARDGLADLLASPPRFILHDLCSGLPDEAGWSVLAPLVAARYRSVAALEPRPDPAAVPLPDPAAGTPTHMVPFVNPWAMTRPGSALVLYERIDR